MGEREQAEDLSYCVVAWVADGHDGDGWYYWDAEYPDEGSVGAFGTRKEALEHATESGDYAGEEPRP